MVAAAAVGMLVAVIGTVRFSGQDLDVYRATGDALLEGRNPYTEGLAGTWLPCLYTPFSAILFVPVAVVPRPAAMFLLTAASLACLWFSVGRFVDAVWPERDQDLRIGITAVTCMLLLASEPVSQTLGFAQVNFFLTALVIGDIARRRPSRWQGAMVGLATSFKLIPGIFIVYLICTRRWRAACVAAGSFAATIAVGWVAMPGGSWSYWVEGLGTDPRQVIGADSIVNGSLLGVLAHAVGYDAARPWWIALAVPTLAAGMLLAVVVHRRVGEMAGLTTTAFVGLVVSPISWSHYWVWFALPALFLARRAWEARDRLAAVGLIVWSLPFYAAPFRLVDDDRWIGVVPTPLESALGGAYAMWAVAGLTIVAVGLLRNGPAGSAQEPDMATSPITRLAR